MATLILDGIDIVTYNVMLQGYSINFPQLKNSGEDIPGRDGVHPVTSSVTANTFPVELVVDTVTVKDAQVVIRNFIAKLDSRKTLHSFIFTDNPDKIAYGKLNSVSQPKIIRGIFNTMAYFSIEIFMPDPYVYDLESVEIEHTFKPGGVLEIDNTGNYECDITLDLSPAMSYPYAIGLGLGGDVSGSTSNIIATLNEEQIGYNTTMHLTDRLVIDSDKATMNLIRIEAPGNIVTETISPNSPDISYTGTWLPYFGNMESAHMGDKASVSFTGVGVKLVMYSRADAGVVKVTLDDTEQWLNTHVADEGAIVVLNLFNLEEKEHTLTIEVIGIADAEVSGNHTDYAIILNSIEVYKRELFAEVTYNALEHFEGRFSDFKLYPGINKLMVSNDNGNDVLAKIKYRRRW